MLKRFLTTKVLGYASMALGFALTLSLSFGMLQTSRLKAARETITIGASANKLLLERVNSDRSLIATRDQLIGKQNAAVAKIVQAAEADRAFYLTRIAAADKVAVTYEANAKAIMARSVTTTDELLRARAALTLIKETINVHP